MSNVYYITKLQILNMITHTQQQNPDKNIKNYTQLYYYSINPMLIE